MKVSVVMPCLNVESYIEECLESVINQSLMDLEILVIDAGSTDGTLDILKKYEEQDVRVRLIHSEKRSYGYQMNLGIAMAEGDYIAIVETDDIADRNMMECLYEKACETDADYVKGMAEGFYAAECGTTWSYNIYPCKDLWKKREITFCPKDTPDLFWTDNFLWYGLYKASFIKKVKFHETPGAAFQDIGALFQIISSAEKGVYINQTVYYYRRSNADASSYNKKSVNFAATEYEYVAQFLQGKSREWVAVYYEKMLSLCLNRFDFMAGVGEFWSDSWEGIHKIQSMINDAIAEKKVFIENFIEKMDQNVDHAKRIRLLLEAPEQLYEYDLQRYRSRRAVVERVGRFVGSDPVIIFGAGLYGKFIHMYLLTHCGNVIGYSDNNADIWGTMVQEIPVFSPEDAMRQNENVKFVIANKRHAEEIEDQLLQMGVHRNQICIYQDTANVFLLMK